MKRLLIVLAATLLASRSLADCPAPLPKEVPAVPEGRSATAQVMAEAGDRVRGYVRSLESYLDCHRSLNALQHNFLVEKAESVAQAYNTELARFFGDEDLLANK